MYSIILPLWEKRCQIIVAAAASSAVVEAVFAAGHNLVWAEADMGTYMPCGLPELAAPNNEQNASPANKMGKNRFPSKL